MLLNITIEDDPDDNDKQPAKPKPSWKPTLPSENNGRTIDETQMKSLIAKLAECENSSDLLKKILGSRKLNKLNELSNSEYQNVFSYIERFKVPIIIEEQ
jgi:hypothetical protein